MHEHRQCIFKTTREAWELKEYEAGGGDGEAVALLRLCLNNTLIQFHPVNSLPA